MWNWLKRKLRKTEAAPKTKYTAKPMVSGTPSVTQPENPQGPMYVKKPLTPTYTPATTTGRTTCGATTTTSTPVSPPTPCILTDVQYAAVPGNVWHPVLYPEPASPPPPPTDYGSAASAASSSSTGSGNYDSGSSSSSSGDYGSSSCDSGSSGGGGDF